MATKRDLLLVSQGELEEMKTLAAQAEENQEKLLRLHAEFENYKKRFEKQREEFLKFATESFVIELLLIVDNFERALLSFKAKHDPRVLEQGVEMIVKEVHSFLKSKNVTRIESLGKKFDPELHEAVDFIKTKDKKDGTIVEELQAGYKMDDRVLRPSRVRVAKED